MDAYPGLGTLLGGRYRLERKLGEGGMGVVYAGVQEPLGRKVAVKVLLPVLARDATLVARFQREAEVAASLGHPNIVQVTDFGVSDGAAFLVMDLLEGESLGAAIAREAPLAPERVRFVATQMLSALEAAHARGVVHRDLKPDNVFLTSVSGVADLVKLLDFGIARLTEDADQKMTATGQVLGTPAYMAPEQARGRPVDARSDLYAVGVVMYEALSGRMPVTGSNYHELMFAIVDETPRPLGELVPGLDARLVAIVDRAMSKDPNARFASATDMRAALDELGPLSARSPSKVPSRPPPTRVSDEVAMAPTVTPEMVSAVPGPRAATPVANVAVETRTSRLPWVLGLGGLVIGLGVAAFAWTQSAPPSLDAPPANPAATEAAAEARAREIAEEVMREAREREAAEAASDTPASDTPASDTPASGTPAASDDAHSESTEQDCRAIVEDTTPLRVRTEPSVRAAVRGELATGARVALLERRGEAWGRIAAPFEGWIWLENVREPCARLEPTAMRHAEPRATSRVVTCGDTTREFPIVRRGDQVVVSMRRTNNVLPIDVYRDVSYSWTPDLTRCYLGKPSVGGHFTLQVDTSGRITRFERNPFCEAPAGLEACLREFLVGSEVGNTSGAPGELQFDISHRRPR